MENPSLDFTAQTLAECHNLHSSQLKPGEIRRVRIALPKRGPLGGYFQFPISAKPITETEAQSIMENPANYSGTDYS